MNYINQIKDYAITFKDNLTKNDKIQNNYDKMEDNENKITPETNNINETDKGVESKKPKEGNTFLALKYLFYSSVFFVLSGISMKYFSANYHSSKLLHYSGFRHLVVVILLYFYMKHMNYKIESIFNTGTYPFWFYLRILVFPLGLFFVIISYQNLKLGIAQLLVNLAPIFTNLGAFLILKEPFKQKYLISCIVCIFGILIMIVGKDVTDKNDKTIVNYQSGGLEVLNTNQINELKHMLDDNDYIIINENINEYINKNPKNLTEKQIELLANIGMTGLLNNTNINSNYTIKEEDIKNHDQHEMNTAKGLIFGIINAVIIAIFFISGKYLSHDFNSFQVTYVSSVYGFVFTIVACLLIYGIKSFDIVFDLYFHFLTFLSAICVVLAYNYTQLAVEADDIGKNTYILYSQIPISVIFGILLFNENLNFYEYLGSTVIIATILITSKMD